MALTRAQLLMGDINNGAILSGQPQGVRPGGAGIAIASDGIISVDPTTIPGVVRLNNGAAYNNYVWPGAVGTAGQQLAIASVGAVTTLTWADADGIPWTQKGQLLVGTGIGTDILLNAGVNTSILIADSTTPSGLAYSNNVTSAMQVPSGTTLQRPTTPVAGQLRYNITTGEFEGFGGSPAGWASVGGVDPGLGINITGNVVKLEIPIQFGPPTAGTLPAEAIDGSMYWDDNAGLMFVRYNDGNSTQWVQIIPSGGGGGGGAVTGTAPIDVTGTVVSLNLGLGLGVNGTNLAFKMPVASTPPATGTGATQAFDGSMYWDATLGQLFIRYNDGVTTQWVAAAPPGGGGSSVTAASLAEAAAGTINTKFSSPQTAVPKDAAGMTGAGILPSGTTAQRPGTPVSGMTRVNTDTYAQLEQYAGGAWQPIGVITSNLTLNVATTGNDTTGLGTAGAPWATPHRAMEYLSQYAIKQGVTVTVAVADGSYTFTTPLNLNHPNGSQIFINGGTTTGARPTTSLTGGNAVGNTGATLAANDTLLNAYYNTKWQFNGCHGLVCDTGGNVTVNTVLIRGNAAAGFQGVMAGNITGGNDKASSGGINLGSTVAVHNFGGNNITTNVGGSIIANNVTSTNSGTYGIFTSYGGSIFAISATASNNGGNGICTNFGGSIRCDSSTTLYNGANGIATIYGGSIYANSATASNNGAAGITCDFSGSINFQSGTASNNQNGILIVQGGSINAAGATANNNTQNGVYLNQGGSIAFSSGTANNNTGIGIACYDGGNIYAFQATATGNGSGSNVQARNMSYIYFTGGNGAGLLSPAANTVGNSNSIIVV